MLLLLLYCTGWSTSSASVIDGGDTGGNVVVSGSPPVLVGERTGSRLYFPLLQYTLPPPAAPAAPAPAAAPLPRRTWTMLRAQTSPDAEGSPTAPNTDAVFVTADHGLSWLYVADEPVQKRMCHRYPLSERDTPALHRECNRQRC